MSAFGRALHCYCRGHRFKFQTGLNLFRPYFHYCLSSFHYCKDCFHIHIFIFSYNNLIYITRISTILAVAQLKFLKHHNLILGIGASLTCKRRLFQSLSQQQRREICKLRDKFISLYLTCAQTSFVFQATVEFNRVTKEFTLNWCGAKFSH